MLVSVGAAMATERVVVLVLVVEVHLMAMRLILEALVQVQLRLIVLVAGTSIEQCMVLPVARVIVHAVESVVGGGVGARGAIGRWRISVVLKEASGVGDGRAVAIKEGVAGVTRVLVLVEILLAAGRPVTIGHHKMERRGGKRASAMKDLPIALESEECRWEEIRAVEDLAGVVFFSST